MTRKVKFHSFCTLYVGRTFHCASMFYPYFRTMKMHNTNLMDMSPHIVRLDSAGKEYASHRFHRQHRFFHLKHVWHE